MKDFIDNFLNASKDRAKNPLIGAFVLSWIIFNWKPLSILLFSNKSIEQKIDIIQPKHGLSEPNFWIPFGIAVFYVVGIPYLMILIDLLTDQSFAKRKQMASDRRVKELNESRRVVETEVELEKLRTEFKDVSRLNDRNKELETRLEQLNKTIDELNADIFNLKNENNSLKSKVRESETVENSIEVKDLEKKIDPDEIKRQKNRLAIRLRGKLKDKIDEFATDIYHNFSEDMDKLSNRLLGQIDNMDDAIESQFLGYDFPKKKDLLKTFKNTCKFLEDDLQEFSSFLKKNSEISRNELNKQLKSFYSPIFRNIEIELT
ncbi:MAG: hypothetical protein Crog4KO_23430 [Crocinitomicaceae bacterium]